MKILAKSQNSYLKTDLIPGGRPLLPKCVGDHGLYVQPSKYIDMHVKVLKCIDMYVSISKYIGLMPGH